jgi:hypothetical protein
MRSITGIHSKALLLDSGAPRISHYWATWQRRTQNFSLLGDDDDGEDDPQAIYNLSLCYKDHVVSTT